MSIYAKSSIAVAVAFSALAGCTTSPQSPVNLSEVQVIRDEVPVMRDAPVAEYATEYVEPHYDEHEQSIVEPVPPEEPVVPTSADDLYLRAKDILQATNDPDAKRIAVDLLTQAADMGHAESMRVLGILALQDGPARQAEAVALLERAAKTNVKAMRQLGILYGNLGTTQLDNTDKAIEYLQSASALGDGDSSLYLSKIMARLGLSDDAKRWRALASDQGVQAQSKGQLKSVESQSANVQRTFAMQRGALAGDPASIYEFAMILLNKQGQGSLMGYEHSAEFEAYYWMRKAAQMGNPQAAEKLNELAYVEDLMRASKVSFEKLNRALGGVRG